MKKGEEQWKLKKGSSQKRKSEDKNSDDTDYPYQRPVLNCRKGVPEGHQWDLTQVELNAMRSRNDDFHDDFGQVRRIYYERLFS